MLILLISNPLSELKMQLKPIKGTGIKFHSAGLLDCQHCEKTSHFLKVKTGLRVKLGYKNLYFNK